MASPPRLPGPAVALLLAALAACAAPRFDRPSVDPPATPAPRSAVPLPPPAAADLENLAEIPLVRLSGDGYARGFRYGRALAADWREAVRRMDGQAVSLVREYLPPKFLARGLARGVAGWVARDCCGDGRLEPEERAYARGLADGAGLDAEDVQRLIAYVVLSDASCSAFAAFGPATEDGRLLQMRNLDWGDAELQASRSAVLLVHEPPSGQRWLSIGFVGLVGSVTGVNESGISLSEIGAGSHERTWSGTPMPFLLDRVLARARTLDEAVRILRDTRTTGGFNFVVGSARERRAAVVEVTARRAAVFEVGRATYEGNPWFRAFPGFDARASTAADPEIRRRQRDAKAPDRSPVGSGAYDRRYVPQIEAFESFGRRLDLPKAFAIAELVAPVSNLQSVVYDVERGRVYVRNQAWRKDGRTDTSEEDRLRLRAAAQPAAVVDLRSVFPPPSR